MTFWKQLGSTLLSGSALLYLLFHWFLWATDIVVNYVWKAVGTTNAHVLFDIRNRSRSKTYRVANISYSNHDGKNILALDSKSLWGFQLKPSQINLIEAAPVLGIVTLADCADIRLEINLQDGRSFWLKGQGLGHERPRIQRWSFQLRDFIERHGLPYR